MQRSEIEGETKLFFVMQDEDIGDRELSVIKDEGQEVYRFHEDLDREDHHH